MVMMYGRVKGDRAKSESDAAAKIDPDVRAEFERYGVKP